MLYQKIARPNDRNGNAHRLLIVYAEQGGKILRVLHVQTSQRSNAESALITQGAKELSVGNADFFLTPVDFKTMINEAKRLRLYEQAD